MQLPPGQRKAAACAGNPQTFGDIGVGLILSHACVCTRETRCATAARWGDGVFSSSSGCPERPILAITSPTSVSRFWSAAAESLPAAPRAGFSAPHRRPRRNVSSMRNRSISQRFQRSRIPDLVRVAGISPKSGQQKLKKVQATPAGIEDKRR